MPPVRKTLTFYLDDPVESANLRWIESFRKGSGRAMGAIHQAIAEYRERTGWIDPEAVPSATKRSTHVRRSTTPVSPDDDYEQRM
jgi:hypothetical protein